VFDPFKDFDTSGYLRNKFAEKDPQIVQELEHQMFRASLNEAITHLAKRRGALRYEDFLAVHRILFEGFYPWAGQDRAATAPEIAVSKAGTWFCHPAHAQLAVQEGLRIGSDKRLLRQHLGEVMGLFAYGHPFLDGNGRTMLVVHTELCHRAGFCIEWHRTSKSDYLTALSAEIAAPGKRSLTEALAVQQPRAFSTAAQALRATMRAWSNARGRSRPRLARSTRTWRLGRRRSAWC